MGLASVLQSQLQFPPQVIKQEEVLKEISLSSFQDSEEPESKMDF